MYSHIKTIITKLGILTFVQAFVLLSSFGLLYVYASDSFSLSDLKGSELVGIDQRGRVGAISVDFGYEYFKKPFTKELMTIEAQQPSQEEDQSEESKTEEPVLVAKKDDELKEVSENKVLQKQSVPKKTVEKKVEESKPAPSSNPTATKPAPQPVEKPTIKTVQPKPAVIEVAKPVIQPKIQPDLAFDTGDALNINFGKPGFSLPGYYHESGGQLRLRTQNYAFGWTRNYSHRFKNVSKGNQKPLNNAYVGYVEFDNTNPASFVIDDITNGTYQVDMVAGSVAYDKNSTHHIRVNRKDVIDCKPASSSRQWCENSVRITVNNNRLEIDQGSRGVNSKLNLVRVKRL